MSSHLISTAIVVMTRCRPRGLTASRRKRFQVSPPLQLATGVRVGTPSPKLTPDRARHDLPAGEGERDAVADAAS